MSIQEPNCPARDKKRCTQWLVPKLSHLLWQVLAAGRRVVFPEVARLREGRGAGCLSTPTTRGNSFGERRFKISSCWDRKGFSEWRDWEPGQAGAAARLLFQQAICSPVCGSFQCKEPDIRAPFVAKRFLSRRGERVMWSWKSSFSREGSRGAPAQGQRPRAQPCGALPRLAGRDESSAFASPARSQEEPPLPRL